MRSIAKPMDAPMGERKQWSPKGSPSDEEDFFSFGQSSAAGRKTWVPKASPARPEPPMRGDRRSPSSDRAERSSSFSSPADSYASPYGDRDTPAQGGIESMFTRAGSSKQAAPANRRPAAGGADIDQEFDSFIEQMLREVDESAGGGASQKSNNDYPDERDELSLDWLDETDDGDYTPPISQESTGITTKSRDKEDSERVLSELLRELKLNDNDKGVSARGSKFFQKDKIAERKTTGPFKERSAPAYNSNRDDNFNSRNFNRNDNSNSGRGISQSSSKSFDSAFDIESLFDDMDDNSASFSSSSNGIPTLDNTLSAYSAPFPNKQKDSRDNSGTAFKGANSKPSSKPSSGGAPDINDFPSFEQYLDALVKFEGGRGGQTAKDAAPKVPSAMSELAAALGVGEFDVTTSGSVSGNVGSSSVGSASGSSGSSSSSRSGSSSSASSSADRASLEGLPVKVLKGHLKTAGLKQVGNKSELVERLISHLER
jgi:hypothetical protein